MPAPGVRVTLIPDPHAVGLIGKEIHQVARVYPLFDVAQILLAERARCRAIFEVEPSRPPLILGKLKANKGNQNYAVPAGTDVRKYKSVAVWCKRFSSGFAVAPLA